MIEKDGWRLVRCDGGKPPRVGDVVTSFNGVSYLLAGGTPPLHENSSGRVWVKARSLETTFYPSVFDLKWERSDDQD